ncbi:MAG: Mur ligase domain-containing protein, partial [Treponema sp.]|nr:Mur ligase domain-containing protein [Treponema sp.]
MASDTPLMGFSELSKAVGGDLHCFCDTGAGDDSGEQGFYSVSIDSRTVREGALFVALPGEAFDGHVFVEAAFSRGASVALVERQKCEALDLPETAKAMGKTLVIVDDTLQGLQDAAMVYLRRFPGL